MGHFNSHMVHALATAGLLVGEHMSTRIASTRHPGAEAIDMATRELWLHMQTPPIWMMESENFVYSQGVVDLSLEVIDSHIYFCLVELWFGEEVEELDFLSEPPNPGNREALVREYAEALLAERRHFVEAHRVELREAARKDVKSYFDRLRQIAKVLEAAHNGGEDVAYALGVANALLETDPFNSSLNVRPSQDIRTPQDLFARIEEVSTPSLQYLREQTVLNRIQEDTGWLEVVEDLQRRILLQPPKARGRCSDELDGLLSLFG